MVAIEGHIIVTSSIAPYRNAIVAAQAYHETKSGPAAKRQDHFVHSTRPCTTHQARSVRHGLTP